MNELKKFGLTAEETAKQLPPVLIRAMRDCLLLVAQTATSKFMIITSTRKKSGLPGIDSPVDAERLTNRSGNLSQSLLRWTHPDSIAKVSMEGSVIKGTLGTSVPYARIHELGGEIPAHQIKKTQQMRKFFWAKWYESDKKEEMWKNMALGGDYIFIPQITMKKRPFLNPAINDRQVQSGITDTMRARLGTKLAASLRSALNG